MAWYDLISPVYDIGALGSGRFRRLAIKELHLQWGNSVLDIACGTGLNFGFIHREIGCNGVIIGVDYSTGMLGKARRKVEKHKWENIYLIKEDARKLSAGLLSQHAGVEKVDKVLCTLGFTVVPEWQDVFETSYELLKEGGRYAIMDWYLDKRTPFAWFLEFISKGDVRRRIWEPLMRAEDFSHRTFFGGRILVASGTKPGNLSLSRNGSSS